MPRIGVQITRQDYNSEDMHSEVIGSIGLAGGIVFNIHHNKSGNYFQT